MMDFDVVFSMNEIHCCLYVMIDVWKNLCRLTPKGKIVFIPRKVIASLCLVVCRYRLS